MKYHYPIYNSNDLLLSAKTKRSRTVKRFLSFTVLCTAIAGTSWSWFRADVNPHSPQQQTVAATPLAQQSESLQNAIVSSFALNTGAAITNAVTSEAVKSPLTPLIVKAQPLQLAASEPKNKIQEKVFLLKKGDTLGKIFSQNGISAKQLQSLMALKDVKTSLKQLKPGTELKLQISPNKELQQLVYAASNMDTLQVTRKKGVLTASIVHPKLDTQLAYASATVTRDLARASVKAGLPLKLTNQLTQIFKDKVDVANVRSGDKIKVLFEENYIKGKKVRTGSIVAAEVHLQGKAYRAVRFIDKQGKVDFYTPEGQSLKKGFDRYPLNYTYISSHFSYNRFDPVAHRIASHPAVDFAAPSGTPIRAASDGKIAFAGRNNGYGNIILIKHDGKYETLYAHMQRFASNIKLGTRVKQGQVIGYVGQTGMATGPHLHYEIHVNGIKQNPLAINLPSAAPLKGAAKNKFIAQARHLMARLQNNSKIHLVENERHDTNG